jgi:hypothetical protein
MSIGTDRLMALVQTRRQGLKQDSLTTIVSTSGGSIGVAVETASSCARYYKRICSRERARSINTKLTLENKKK